MRRVKALIATITLATTVWLNVHKADNTEVIDEEDLPISPVYAEQPDAIELATLEMRRQAKEARQVQPKQPTKAQAISRGNNYVGKAQTYEATFYTAFCPTGCIGVTASGYDVSSTIYYEGMRVLAAPKSVPMYSIMRVTLADGTTFDGIVLDRGSDIGSGRIDILVETRDEAYKLGRQSVEVRMIRRGK